MPRSVAFVQVFEQNAHYEDDFSDVKGQDYAKRALVIAEAVGFRSLDRGDWAGKPGVSPKEQV